MNRCLLYTRAAGLMLLIALALLFGACGGSASPAASQQSSASPTANQQSSTATATPTPAPGTVRLDVRVSDLVQAPAKQPATATATCPSGEQLVSGGYSANVFESVGVAASYPSASNAWTVVASSSASSIELTAYANCLQANVPIQVTIAHTAGSGTIRAACPSGTVLTGGGWQQADDAVPANNGWQVDGATNGTVYALCASSASLAAAPAVSKMVKLPAGFGNSGGGSADCPSGQIATGGGFSGSYDVYAESLDGTSWSVTGYGFSETAQSVVIWVVCVRASAG